MVASEKMIALRVHEFGPPNAIVEERIPIPAPGPDELLVKVHGAGVGPWDAWIRSGRSVLEQPLPLTLGSDVAGIVEAVGTNVDGFATGDRVYGVTNPRFTGGYAEYAVCKAAMMAQMPDNLTFDEAASAPVVGVTAWQMLFDEAKLIAGQTVMISGAAGSVGTYAVSLALAADLRVVAIGRHQQLNYLRQLGAHEAILDSELGRWAKMADAAIDLVGGHLQRQLLACVKAAGALVTAVPPAPIDEAKARGVRASFLLVHVETRYLDYLTNRFLTGQIKPHVGTVMPLSRAREAHELLEHTRAAKPGKIVLVPSLSAPSQA